MFTSLKVAFCTNHNKPDQLPNLNSTLWRLFSENFYSVYAVMGGRIKMLKNLQQTKYHCHVKYMLTRLCTYNLISGSPWSRFNTYIYEPETWFTNLCGSGDLKLLGWWSSYLKSFQCQRNRNHSMLRLWLFDSQITRLLIIVTEFQNEHQLDQGVRMR